MSINWNKFGRKRPSRKSWIPLIYTYTEVFVETSVYFCRTIVLI